MDNQILNSERCCATRKNGKPCKQMNKPNQTGGEIIYGYCKYHKDCRNTPVRNTPVRNTPDNLQSSELSEKSGKSETSLTKVNVESTVISGFTKKVDEE
jgi:hypothetical protein